MQSRCTISGGEGGLATGAELWPPSGEWPGTPRPPGNGLLESVHDLLYALTGVEVPVGTLALEEPLAVAEHLFAPLVEWVRVLVFERLVEVGGCRHDDRERPPARLADIFVADNVLGRQRLGVALEIRVHAQEPAVYRVSAFGLYLLPALAQVRIVFEPGRGAALAVPLRLEAYRGGTDGERVAHDGEAREPAGEGREHGGEDAGLLYGEKEVGAEILAYGDVGLLYHALADAVHHAFRIVGDGAAYVLAQD